ncbi:MAG: ParB/RepB/Spo0J family partition protein [Hormoscilla sp.]
MSNGEKKSAAMLISIESIQLPSQQPRRYFDPDKMAQLTESVRHHGILEPLLVRDLGEYKYELVVGERRYRAARELGLSEVPATIKQLTDSEALQISMIENLQREDLNPVEETEGILTLLSVRLELAVDSVGALLHQMQNQLKGKVKDKVDEGEMETVTKVFEELGGMSWESFVNNRLPLLKLPPEMLEVLRQGKIAYTKAKAIAAVKDEEARKELLQEALEKKLSLAAIKEKIAEFQPDRAKSSPEVQIKDISSRLNKAKLWKQDPQRWEKVRVHLAKIEALLKELENG